jgi:ABC-type antimicrobial peptide transport system permease subunit
MEISAKMKELGFKVRFAWKNIIRNLGNSLSVFLSLVLTMMLLVIIFNMRLCFERTYYYQDKEKYGEIDIVITYDENATARLVNRRKLINNYLDDIKSPLVFFNLFVLAGTNEETFYVELMSASKVDMELLIGEDFTSLGSQEVIITESLAKQQSLGENAQLTIMMLGKEYIYTIVQIVPDKGLFSGDTVFVDKNTLISDFYGLSGLNNLGNTIYVDVINETEIDAVFEQIKIDEEYQDYLIMKTVNEEINRNRATYNSTIMIGITALVLIALAMVVHSLFPLMSRKVNKQYALIRIFGGEDQFVFSVWIIEILILAIIAGILGTGFAFLVANFSSRSYGVKTIIHLGWWQTLVALLLVVSLLIVEAWARFSHIKKQGVISLSSDIRYQRVKPRLWFFLVLAAFCAITMVAKPFSYPVNALIIIISCIIASFLGITILLYETPRLSPKRKPSLFARFNLKYLRDNRYIHHSLEILYACLLVIVTALSIRSHIIQETATFKEQLNFDYAITNIFDYDDELITQLETVFPVDHTASMSFSSEALFDLGGSELKLFSFCMMMPYTAFVDSFAFTTKVKPTQELLASKAPFALLPTDYRYTHLLDVGDTIYLHTDTEYGIISLEVGGFFDVSYPNIIYTNLSEVDEYASLFPMNTVIVNSDRDLLADLATTYGEEMYYIVPIDDLINYYGSMYQTAADLALAMVGVVIASFMIVIINNTLLVFQTIKGDYAKLRVMGAGFKNLFGSLAKEVLISLAVIMIFFIPSIMVFTKALPKLMLFFNYHREIIPKIGTIILGIALVTIAFSASYLIYAHKVKRLDLIAEIKYE